MSIERRGTSPKPDPEEVAGFLSWDEEDHEKAKAQRIASLRFRLQQIDNTIEIAKKLKDSTKAMSDLKSKQDVVEAELISLGEKVR